jgi:Uma2 family endonuclease
MSTTATNPISIPPTPVPTKPRRRKPGRAVRIPNVPWEMYEELLDVFAEKPIIRMAYDNEELEIMVPSLDHDFSDRILAAFIPILTEECGLPLRPGGSTTLKLKKSLKGIEGDDIFWIANAAKLAGVKDLNLTIHPPPDLALEVDVSRSSMNRLKIYAKLGVPEVWRLDGDELTFYVLTGKKYQAVARSQTFPILAPGDVIPFLKQARDAGDQQPVYRAFRAWVKQRVAATTATATIPPPPTTP